MILIAYTMTPVWCTYQSTLFIHTPPATWKNTQQSTRHPPKIMAQWQSSRNKKIGTQGQWACIIFILWWDCIISILIVHFFCTLCVSIGRFKRARFACIYVYKYTREYILFVAAPCSSPQLYYSLVRGHKDFMYPASRPGSCLSICIAIFWVQHFQYLADFRLYCFTYHTSVGQLEECW